MSYEKLKERMERRKEARERELKRIEKRALALDEEEARDNEELRKLKVDEANNENRKAQKLFAEDKKERQKIQDVKNEAKTEKASLMRAYESARLNIERDRQNGLSQEEIRFKYLDKDARIRQMNKEAEKGNKSVLDKTRAKFGSHLDSMY